MMFSIWYSIRFKLFAAIGGIILFFVAFSWLLNSTFLEKYYYSVRKQYLIENYKYVYDIYNGDLEEVAFDFEMLERTKSLHIFIIDKNYNIKYASIREIRYNRRRQPGWNVLPSEYSMPEFLIKQRIERLSKGEVLVENRRDDRLQTNFISLFSSLKNGDFIILNIPITSIKESVNISNNFFMFTGVITIFIGSIFVILITGKFTKPILELNEIAQGMSQLDFSRRYPVKNRDEIGKLGESINSLSEQLEKSISELTRANQKLREDIEKERKIDEMRKEFISNVSHELKTPIALIQGYAEGLKVNVNEDPENKDFYCNVIIDESMKMNKLVKQLLELSQMESGKTSLERVDFSINDLIEQVLRKNELIFKEKNINVIIKMDRDIYVNADFEKTEQVLMNYLSNALNHVDERKIVKISAKLPDDISDNHKKGKIIISVFNSGKLIPGKDIKKIWTSFYKIDKARTRAYGGTGLGLSIVKAIQEAHGNRYGVINLEKEGGVEFWFELDLR
ncbi:MAG TPA: HAMP domain-containing sensor histidine kinase [Clostridiales bacterium]|nr:HAMP domain-containing sensor histidine kinase [Clostridiales bacterium]